MKKHCKTCKFMGTSIDNYFVCRKLPPRPNPEHGRRAQWPCIDPENDWCGCGKHPVMQKTKSKAKKPAAKTAKKK
jgi:hypothetical protein